MRMSIAQNYKKYQNQNHSPIYTWNGAALNIWRNANYEVFNNKLVVFGRAMNPAHCIWRSLNKYIPVWWSLCVTEVCDFQMKRNAVNLFWSWTQFSVHIIEVISLVYAVQRLQERKYIPTCWSMRGMLLIWCFSKYFVFNTLWMIIARFSMN